MYNSSIKVLNMIIDKGYKAYIVGGYPRDLYLNRKSADIDICTNASPKELKAIFKDIILPSNAYGSVTVVYNNIRFEITTFRKEIKYENNRLPVKIKYIDNLLEDLKRRDFTINTLCMDHEGNIIDLLNGRLDLDNKVIRVVGSARYKLKEDCLRILRAIRFATILDFDLDESLSKAIKKYGYLLKKLSYFRKKDELDKIFSSPNVLRGIKLIKELELDKYLELSNLDELVVTTSLIGIWAQLDVLNIYSFTNNERELISNINELRDKDVLDDYNLYKYGLYISSIVGEIKGINKRLITRKYNELPIYNRKDIVISVNEICKLLKREKGGYLRDILDDLEIKIIKNEIENEKEAIEQYILNKYTT
ncbi:MAG: hypothetical protein PHD10_03385 [Bacilli bacterium]|nr:hypothetical protein [Bacilli bacterium]MDD4608155.1 hypothetical protein [Bacilli bacterium]